MVDIQAEAFPRLAYLDTSSGHSLSKPRKKIHEGADVSFFHTSKAYRDIVTFVLQLNGAMFPRMSPRDDDEQGSTQVWTIGSPFVQMSEAVNRLSIMLSRINDLIDEAPPDPGPRRFGNVSFRKWYGLFEDKVQKFLSDAVDIQVSSADSDLEKAREELRAYLLGSFGSAQRLDYGTGHELSFIAFLAGIWKLKGFASSEQLRDGAEERAIVLGVFHPYLKLVRRLIKVYNLEPAGSHGVWGLDDHAFLPYMFGSAQLAPAIADVRHVPTEGSLKNAADPGDVTKHAAVTRLRDENLYFGAIGFIYDVKKGPFWEHSPMLYDISGVKAGWAKINKGMIKMYMAEVLSKFPVVQHFPFGGIFLWEKDPNAATVASTTHVASQPAKTQTSKLQAYAARETTNAPSRDMTSSGTAAPRANAPSASANAALPSAMPATVAPWAKRP
ncbi:MAG: Serine/threonine-protein phosphatase 2A activator 1 [Chrysothrix sp. TS-e1954]|nr:MAG: Serine/threonine-protein phosphatase 2A activator 1 [Chrysothrix sp. TS-e1954]